MNRSWFVFGGATPKVGALDHLITFSDFLSACFSCSLMLLEAWIRKEKNFNCQKEEQEATVFDRKKKRKKEKKEKKKG